MRQTPILLYQDTEDLATAIGNTELSYAIFKDKIYGDEHKGNYLYTRQEDLFRHLRTGGFGLLKQWL